MVANHTRWLECLETCKSADALTPHPTCRNQEQSRFIAISQPSAGALFNISPDGTFATTVMDLHFEIAAQRRGGLHISSAEPVFGAMEAEGAEADRKGNLLSNSGEYNRRHNGVLHKGYLMTNAVSVGRVVLGDIV